MFCYSFLKTFFACLNCRPYLLSRFFAFFSQFGNRLQGFNLKITYGINEFLNASGIDC